MASELPTRLITVGSLRNLSSAGNIFAVATYLAPPQDKTARITNVVQPECITRHGWERLLYNQTATRPQEAFIDREHAIVADLPYRRVGRSPARRAHGER